MKMKDKDAIIHGATFILVLLALVDIGKTYSVEYVTHQQSLLLYAVFYILFGILLQIVRLENKG